MRMIWTFAWKEFLLNVRSARFQLGLLLCLVIVPFTMIVSVNDYKIQVQVCQAEMEQAQANMDSSIVWSAVRPVVVRSPEALSLFSRGINDHVGSTVAIWLDSVPVFPDRIVSMLNNPFMKVFPILDFTGILGIMISLLALIFSYDTVTQEREEGTLRFVFSSSVNRPIFLVGKWLGVILTVVPIIVFCFGMALGFVSWKAGVSLSQSEWGGVGWMLLASFIYLSLFAWMGIFISTLNSRSANSVVSCMLCWLFFLFVIPSVVSYLSRNLDLPTADEHIENQKKEMSSRFWKEKSQAHDSIRNVLGMDHVRYLFYMGGRDGKTDLRGGSRLVLEHTRRMAVREYELQIEHADRCWQLEAGYLRELARQQQWQFHLNVLSPSATFSRLMSSICRTDTRSFQSFMDEVRGYRECFSAFLWNQGLVHSIAYVTPLSESDFGDNEAWLDERQILLQENPSLESLIKEAEQRYMNRWYQPVDTSGFPVFTPSSIGGWDRLWREWPTFLFLALLSFGFMGGAVYVFRKYDLR